MNTRPKVGEIYAYKGNMDIHRGKIFPIIREDRSHFYYGPSNMDYFYYPNQFSTMDIYLIYSFDSELKSILNE